jgi:hypothetical protein
MRASTSIGPTMSSGVMASNTRAAICMDSLLSILGKEARPEPAVILAQGLAFYRPDSYAFILGEIDLMTGVGIEGWSINRIDP